MQKKYEISGATDQEPTLPAFDELLEAAGVPPLPAIEEREEAVPPLPAIEEADEEERRAIAMSLATMAPAPTLSDDEEDPELSEAIARSREEQTKPQDLKSRLAPQLARELIENPFLSTATAFLLNDEDHRWLKQRGFAIIEKFNLGAALHNFLKKVNAPTREFLDNLIDALVATNALSAQVTTSKMPIINFIEQERIKAQPKPTTQQIIKEDPPLKSDEKQIKKALPKAEVINQLHAYFIALFLEIAKENKALHSLFFENESSRLKNDPQILLQILINGKSEMTWEDLGLDLLILHKKDFRQAFQTLIDCEIITILPNTYPVQFILDEQFKRAVNHIFKLHADKLLQKQIDLNALALQIKPKFEKYILDFMVPLHQSTMASEEDVVDMTQEFTRYVEKHFTEKDVVSIFLQTGTTGLTKEQIKERHEELCQLDYAEKYYHAWSAERVKLAGSETLGQAVADPLAESQNPSPNMSTAPSAFFRSGGGEQTDSSQVDSFSPSGPGH